MPAMHPVTVLSGSRLGEGAHCKPYTQGAETCKKPIEGQIVVGVDTHKEIHVAAAVDWRGTLVDEKSFATTRQGYRQLESWARSLGGRAQGRRGMLRILWQRADKAPRQERLHRPGGHIPPTRPSAESAERTTSSTPRWPPRPRSPAPGR